MEHGGLLYWTSLYEHLDSLDHHTDERFLEIATPDQKYALLAAVWRPAGRTLGLMFDAWEETDLAVQDLPVVLDIVRVVRRDPRTENLHPWLDRAEAYLARALEMGEGVSVGL